MLSQRFHEAVNSLKKGNKVLLWTPDCSSNLSSKLGKWSLEPVVSLKQNQQHWFWMFTYRVCSATIARRGYQTRCNEQENIHETEMFAGEQRSIIYHYIYGSFSHASTEPARSVYRSTNDQTNAPTQECLLQQSHSFTRSVLQRHS